MLSTCPLLDSYLSRPLSRPVQLRGGNSESQSYLTTFGTWLHCVWCALASIVLGVPKLVRGLENVGGARLSCKAYRREVKTKGSSRRGWREGGNLSRLFVWSLLSDSGTLYILYRRGGIPKETINVELGLSRISARWRDCPKLRRCLGTRVTTEIVRMGLRKVPEWKGVLKVLDTRRWRNELGFD